MRLGEKGVEIGLYDDWMNQPVGMTAEWKLSKSLGSHFGPKKFPRKKEKEKTEQRIIV